MDEVWDIVYYQAPQQSSSPIQSVISRVENAKTIPSLSFLKRLAEVLNVVLKVEFTV